MNELIPTNITPIKLFTENGLEPILNEIKKKVDEFVPDIETPSGRKEIASFAYKIAQSKTFIEKAGKELVSKQKEAIKLIDNERKRSRDFLDEQRDRARQPLTEWEEAEKKAIEEEERKIRLEADHTEALAEDDLFNRQREVERKEAELAKMLEERRIEEEKLRLEREREEREDFLKKEAAGAAEKKAKEALLVEKERAIRLEVEAKAEKERAVLEAIRKAEEKAAKMEADRLEKEAKEKARKEVERIAAEKRAAHHKHREKIDKEALEDLGKLGFDKEGAKMFVQAVANGAVRHITINY